MSRPGEGRQLVICGLGGQGILFVARILAGAAMLDGDEVLMAETHGMAQRGGAVEAHLKLGDYRSSLVRRGSADAVLVLHPSRVEAGVPLLCPAGVCFANAPTPAAGTDRVRTLDAAEESRAMAYARGQNLVLLGFAAVGAPEVFPTRTSLLAVLESHSPEVAREQNRAAFERGVERAGAS